MAMNEVNSFLKMDHTKHNAVERINAFRQWLIADNNRSNNYDLSFNNSILTANNLDDVYNQMSTLKANIDGMEVEDFAKQRGKLSVEYDKIKNNMLKFVEELSGSSLNMEKIMNSFIEYEKTIQAKVNSANEKQLEKIFDNLDKDFPAESAQIRKAENELNVANQQLQYAADLATGTKPIVAMRLEASKRVWQAQKDLRAAQKGLEDAVQLGVNNAKGGRKDDKKAEAEAEAAAAAAAAAEAEATAKAAAEAEAAKRAAAAAARLAEKRAEGGVIDEYSARIEELMAGERPPLKQWPKYIYTTESDQPELSQAQLSSSLNSGELSDGEKTRNKPRVLCYIRAPADCLPEKSFVTCKYADPMISWPDLPNNAEIIGKMITITAVNKAKTCILPSEPWIIGIPHSYARNPIRETVIYVMEEGNINPEDTLETITPGTWRDVHTTDVANEDSRYLEMRLPRMGVITLAPAVRVRRDVAEIGRFGGRLMCLADARISLTVPAGAIRVNLPFILQVQQIDQSQALALKEQAPGMAEFISSSALVTLTCPTKKLFKSIQITLLLPDQQAGTSMGANLQAGSGVPGRSGPGGGANSALSDGAIAQVGRRTSTVTDDQEGEISDPTTGPGKNTKFMLDDFQKSLILPQLLAGV